MLLLLRSNGGAATNGGWRSYIGFWFGGYTSVSGAAPVTHHYLASMGVGPVTR